MTGDADFRDVIYFADFMPTSETEGGKYPTSSSLNAFGFAVFTQKIWCKALSPKAFCFSFFFFEDFETLVQK